MDVKEAVATAKSYIQNLFGEEGIAELGLEEVEFEDIGDWLVTIGFTRSWDRPSGVLQGLTSTRRSYKVVRIQDSTGKILSVKNREPKS